MASAIHRRMPNNAPSAQAIELLRELSLTSLAQRELERRIVSGEIVAGAKLNEIDVAGTLQAPGQEAHGPQLGGEYGLPTAQTGAVPSGLVGIFWHQPILPTDPGAGRVVAAPRAHVLLETVALAAYQDSAFAGLGRRFENCDPAWRQ